MEQSGVTTLIVETGRNNYATEIKYGRHTLISDEPEIMGGGDKGMDPTSLLLSALGSCTAITLRMYADRKEWDIEKIRVELSLEVRKSGLQQTTYIRRHLSFDGPVDPIQKERLLKIADQCPLHKILSNPVVITTNVTGS